MVLINGRKIHLKSIAFLIAVKSGPVDRRRRALRAGNPHGNCTQGERKRTNAQDWGLTGRSGAGADILRLVGRRSGVREAVIVSAVRTPIGKFQGALQSFAAPRLGALVVREAVRRAGVEPAQVDECIMGCVLQAGLGQNPARQAAIHGGLPAESAALTVNQVCGSGLRAVALAAPALRTGDAEGV